MNWDAIGAIAELLAAIGVIVSLIFVGLQVKKSNAEARLATIQATTDTEIMMVSAFADHAENESLFSLDFELPGFSVVEFDVQVDYRI